MLRFLGLLTANSGVVFLLALVMLQACGTTTQQTKHVNASYTKIWINGKAINLGGDLTFKNLVILEEALQTLQKHAPKSVRSINSINFINNADHFPYNQRAHAFFDDICLYEGSTFYPDGSVTHVEIDLETIWHEVAHAYTYILGYRFLDEWIAIAGNVYQGERYGFYREDYEEKIIAGVVSAYGLMNEKEDVAEWVEEIYSYNRGLGSVFNDPKRIDKSDPRFLKKLELLYKKEFISREIYEKIKPLLR
ncbi:MAG: hypothetical protein HYT03_01545 [Candidatus Harrisonbacteria bacterium]|nr:hypothetical protein [Candidatus Harrisonbacteria bacterium]